MIEGLMPDFLGGQMKEGHCIWLENKWTHVDSSRYEGIAMAQFEPIHTMFLTVFVNDIDWFGNHDLAMLIVNDDGDKLYAPKRALVRYAYDNNKFHYLISPADFLNTEKTLSVEIALGNPLALELRV